MLTNKEILNGILNSQVFQSVTDIDNTYGQWTESFIPVNNGYKKVIHGASNWTYCSCCGNPYYDGIQNCRCEEGDEEFITNSDLFKRLKPIKQSLSLAE